MAENKAYWRKELTPEVKEFERDRRAIQSDMDKDGYTPYFDPAKRSDVDPTHYPTDINTSVDSMPAKPATVQKYRESYQTDEASQRLLAGYEEGKKIPEAQNWHAAKQIEDAYINVLGPEAGRQEFKLFADLMAATTAGNTPTANFLMAHYASVMNKLGSRLPKHGYEPPYPIGGGYGARNLAQAQKQLDTSAGFGAANPKRHDFSASISGHTNMPPVDSVISNAIVPGMRAPQHYGPASELLKIIAGNLGVDPRHFQDLTRAGLQKLQYDAKRAAGLVTEHHPFRPDGPLIKVVNDSIEKTHRLTGVPRDTIVEEGLVLKKRPMYGIGGAALGPLTGYGLHSLTSDSNSSTRDGSL